MAKQRNLRAHLYGFSKQIGMCVSGSAKRNNWMQWAASKHKRSDGRTNTNELINDANNDCGEWLHVIFHFIYFYSGYFTLEFCVWVFACERTVEPNDRRRKPHLLVEIIFWPTSKTRPECAFTDVGKKSTKPVIEANVRDQCVSTKRARNTRPNNNALVSTGVGVELMSSFFFVAGVWQ